MQPKFRVAARFALFLMPLLVLAAAARLQDSPSRQPLPDRTVPVRFEPIQVPGAAGAWRVEADDPGFGGISALALAGPRLLALTDSGVLVLLPKPGKAGSARLHDLPAGPGNPNSRRWRDSEALLRDRAGYWWVTFENRHSLWRYDPAFSRAQSAFPLQGQGWPRNKGVEAIVDLGPRGLLLLPERGSKAVVVGPGRIGRVPLRRESGEIADAVRMPGGEVLVLVRQIGMTGIVNRLARLVDGDGGYRLQPLMRIAVGPTTNLEAIAAEPLPNGATRLWIMSDNDFSTWRSTILLALDLPAPG